LHLTFQYTEHFDYQERRDGLLALHVLAFGQCHLHRVDGLPLCRCSVLSSTPLIEQKQWPTGNQADTGKNEACSYALLLVLIMR
jgi:hypothetical protein